MISVDTREHTTKEVAGSCAMPIRTLRIVKRTALALAICESCQREFHSLQRVEDDAEREMRALFERHACEDRDVVGTVFKAGSKGATNLPS